MVHAEGAAEVDDASEHNQLDITITSDLLSKDAEMDIAQGYNQLDITITSDLLSKDTEMDIAQGYNQLGIIMFDLLSKDAETDIAQGYNQLGIIMFDLLSKDAEVDNVPEMHVTSNDLDVLLPCAQDAAMEDVACQAVVDAAVAVHADVVKNINIQKH